MKINLEGQQMTGEEDVRQLYDMPRQVSGPGVISGGQTPEEIDLQMTKLVKPLQQVLQGIGAAKVEPVHMRLIRLSSQVLGLLEDQLTEVVVGCADETLAEILGVCFGK